MIIAAADVGIDDTAVAVFDTSRWPERNLGFDWMLNGVRCLVDVHQCKTSPHVAEPYRYGVIAQWTRDLLTDVQAELLFVEWPIPYHAKLSFERGKDGRQLVQSKNVIITRDKLNRAVGAVCAGAHLAQVDTREVDAFKSRKDERKSVLNAYLRQLNLQPIKNPDKADAAWLGLSKVVEIMRPAHRARSR